MGCQIRLSYWIAADCFICISLFICLVRYAISCFLTASSHVLRRVRGESTKSRISLYLQLRHYRRNGRFFHRLESNSRICHWYAPSKTNYTFKLIESMSRNTEYQSGMLKVCRVWLCLSAPISISSSIIRWVKLSRSIFPCLTAALLHLTSIFSPSVLSSSAQVPTIVWNKLKSMI